LFATEATVSRHVDDMEAAGTLRRVPDAKDRRRLRLLPTERLAEIGRSFLQARVDIARRHGFVFCPTEAAGHGKATDS
jgi:DNA-binding MarR family transcriptional regulator